MENDKQITLQLTINETNTLLTALGNMPFQQVYHLVNKIQTQASQQLEEGEGVPVKEQPVKAKS